MKKKRIITGIILAFFLVSNIPLVNVKSNDESNVQDFANVVLFAYFSDEENPEYFNETSVKDSSKTAWEYIQRLYDGDYGRSFTNYMNTISGGQFKVHNIFPQLEDGKINAYKLPYTKSQAQNSNIDYSMITNLISNYTFASDEVIDYNGDGCIDNLTVILVGEADYAYSGQIPTLYPHQSSYPGDKTVGGKLVRSYNVLNTSRLMSDESGVMCHEFLHTLGYPDLYVSDMSSTPVGNWDIMARSSKYVSYPLAYLRMYFSDWEEIETVTASCELSLSLPGEGGNQAYILKSPQNPYELFVVERRQKADYTDENSIDSSIGGSGIIVYRVDTTVNGLSNFHGDTAIYVFRPQPGMPGYSSIESQALGNAALSLESGRTSIGSSDMNAGFEDGALTFSDGSNSGIVIENVSSYNDDRMTISVTIPEISSFDMWNDTMLPAAERAVVASVGNEIYSAASKDGQIQLYKYNAGQWEACGTPVSDMEGVSEIRMKATENALVLSYSDGYGELTVMSYDIADGIWNVYDTVQNVNDFDMEADGGHAYISYAVDNSEVYLSEINTENASYNVLGRAFGDSLCGNPRVLICNNEVYVSVRDVSNSNKIVVKKYDGSDSFTEIVSPGNASAYTIIGYNDTMYYASGSSTSGITVKKYNGTSWEDYALKNDIDSYEPELAVAQGNLYVLTSPATTDSTERTRVFDITDGTFREEGTAVDLKSRRYSLAASGDSLFVSYINNSDVAVIKQKTTANSLLSLTLTPPDKTVYLKGETVSLDGLKVVANYINGSRELTVGEYTVTGFAAENPGDNLATVSFGGISNTFSYTVYEESEPSEQITFVTSVKLEGISQPVAGEKVYGNVSSSTAGITVSGTEWNPAGTDFDYDTVYKLSVTLKTESGYAFADSLSVNGGDIAPDIKKVNDNEVLLTYLFEATQKADAGDEESENSSESEGTTESEGAAETEGTTESESAAESEGTTESEDVTEPQETTESGNTTEPDNTDESQLPGTGDNNSSALWIVAAAMAVTGILTFGIYTIKAKIKYKAG